MHTDGSVEFAQSYFSARGVPGEIHRVETADSCLRLAKYRADQILFVSNVSGHCLDATIVDGIGNIPDM